MKDALRVPDVQVTVTLGGSEICAFAAWLDTDIHQGLQSVCAIDNPAAVKTVCAILQAAQQKLLSAHWVNVDVLDAFEAQEAGVPPF